MSTKNGQYIRLDDAERARRALLSCVAAMELREYDSALVLAAIVCLHLGRIVPAEDALTLVRNARAEHE